MSIIFDTSFREFQNDYQDRASRWDGSKYRMIVTTPSIREVGKRGEVLLKDYYLPALGIQVRAGGRDCDCHLGMQRIPVELKLASEQATGMRTVNQFRPNQVWDYVIILSARPFDEPLCWVVPQEVAIANSTNQHGGNRGSGDTKMKSFREPPHGFLGGELDLFEKEVIHLFG